MQVLKDWVQADRDAYERLCEHRGCTCFISAPCGCCTHPGNPLSQENDDDCWEEVFDLDESCEKAMERLRKAIDLSYECHKFELFEAGLEASVLMAARHLGVDPQSLAECSRLEKLRLRLLLFGNNKKCAEQHRCV